MELKTDSTKPIFIQIAEIIEDQILKSIIKEEEQVYSTNELSTLLQVNPATARKGLNLLVGKEIIYKKRGVGMFVKTGAVEIIKTSRLDSFFKNYIIKMINEGEKLGVNREEMIKMIQSYSGGANNE